MRPVTNDQLFYRIILKIYNMLDELDGVIFVIWIDTQYSTLLPTFITKIRQTGPIKRHSIHTFDISIVIKRPINRENLIKNHYRFLSPNDKLINVNLWEKFSPGSAGDPGLNPGPSESFSLKLTTQDLPYGHSES